MAWQCISWILSTAHVCVFPATSILKYQFPSFQSLSEFPSAALLQV